jgi:hypothetical protein
MYRASLWLLFLSAACHPERAPEGIERQIAPRAAALAKVAVRPHRVDPSLEHWEVARTGEGWVVNYSYDLEGLSIDWHAAFANSEKGEWMPTGVFGKGVRPGENVSQEPADPLPWGEEGGCVTIRVSDLDIGFECFGRHGRRSFAAKVYGVSPHGAGAPSLVLASALRALDQWDPRDAAE